MKLILYLFSLLLLVSSCRHDFEQPSWNTDITTPIAYSNLSFLDLFNDSSIRFDTLGDNSLQFIFTNELLNYTLDSLIKIKPISTTKNVKLETINFSNTVISHQVTMGDLIASIDFGTLLFPNGGNAIIPSYSGLLNDTFPIDANEYFEEMTFIEGSIYLKIINQLPTDLSNVELVLRNENANSSFISMTIPNLASGQTAIESASLAGQTLMGNLEAEILNADIVGTAPNSVTINYSDALIAEITIRDIDLQEGIAIFPSQQIFDEDTVVAFEIGDVRLSRVIVEEGGVEVVGVSTIQDTIKVEYKIPGTTLNGQPFEFFYQLPPAPVGGSISVTKFFDFSGYEIDMTGQFGDTVNTIYTESQGWIDSSGVITHISLEDSVFNTITIKEIIPKIAYGYLGTDTFSESYSTEFLDFADFEGQIDLSQVEVSLNTENFIGANANVWIRNFSAQNNTSSLSLNSSSLSTPFYIESATENNSEYSPITASESIILFNESNSNIDEIIESKPQQLNFDFELIINPNSATNNGFMYKGYGVKSSLDVKVPLSFSASNIILNDTVEVDLNVDDLNDGYFTVLAQNSFPIDAQIKVILLDQNNMVLEELLSNQLLQASEVNMSGKTISTTTSELTFPFESISESLNLCRKIAFEIILNTQPQEQYITIYSDYTIDLKLIANFNYTID
ncbi:MAG: hypothetical protein ACON4E_02950 [Flavobacteriales bacterium]